MYVRRSRQNYRLAIELSLLSGYPIAKIVECSDDNTYDSSSCNN
jgi:hypothetical protein